MGANFFVFRLRNDPRIVKRRQNENGRVALPESVSIHPFTYLEAEVVFDAHFEPKYSSLLVTLLT